MRDLNILRYVSGSLWAITADKWAELLPVLVRHVQGDRLSAADIAARLGDRTESGSLSRPSQTAVIPIRGVIAHRMNAMEESSGGTSTEGIGAMLRQVAADESISTIIYDIDSPGGTVPGVQELAAQMFALRGVKKQIAQVNSLAASAAYWLAAQCDEIVSLPSGSAGSIGVYAVHQDVSEALANAGVKMTLVKAGKHKTEGNPFEPLSEEALATLQTRVDDAYTQFVRDVARGRGVSAAEVRSGFGEGRVLPAKEAKAAGLIDRIGTLDETLARVTGRPRSGMRAMTTEEGVEIGRAISEGLAAAESVDVSPVVTEAVPSADDTLDEADLERRWR